MAITGVGIDIEKIDRFRKVDYSKNKAFYEKIFTKKEMEHCLEKKDPYPRFTSRFTAKEAFIKASESSIKNLKDIEVLTEDNKPIIKTSVISDKTIHLSLSHTKDMAIAIVIIEDLN